MLKQQILSLLAVPALAGAQWDTAQPLTYGSPESVGLLSRPFKELEANASSYLVAHNYSSATYDQVHPLYPGVTLLVGHQNRIVEAYSAGKALLYADANGTLLPEDQQIGITNDSIYDLASLTKLITTVLALDQIGQLMYQGTIHVNQTVATYMPEFAVHGKGAITIEQLMTHTSGFAPDPVPPLYPNYTTQAERVRAIVTQKLANAPGSAFVYSDLNFMNLGLVLERVTNQTLDVLLQERLACKIGMSDTFYNVGNKPANEVPQYSRMVAEEFQIEVLGSVYEPPRPQPVRGTVHDENAWALNGVSGHAGVFSTAHDLAIFCQMILNNGSYAGTKVLEPWTVDLIFHNYNTKFPEDAHGLGFELNQTYWDGSMRSLQTAGHTGFTGTTLWIDRPSGTFALHLTNRVHPSRTWSSTNIAREWLGYFVAQALGRHPTGPY